MTVTPTPTRHARSAAKQNWAEGLVAFAAVMLMITGVLAICRGVMAILEDDVFVTTPDFVFEFDLTGWGWVHVGLGIAAVLVSFGLFQVTTWSRIAGVAIAGLVIIANFLSLPYSPVWSIILIAMSGFIIWALCVVRPEAADTGMPPAAGTGEQPTAATTSDRTSHPM